MVAVIEVEEEYIGLEGGFFGAMDCVLVDEETLPCTVERCQGVVQKIA
jgi:hypothetical protein